ncbi:MAG: hypothetical protein HOL27_08235, partial [Candidatus Marinimicrobia bacterium]|nr:hypothetical protein [Candidatus Neomarinimicrobiota bacterium]
MKKYLPFILLISGLLAQNFVPGHILIQSEKDVSFSELQSTLDDQRYHIVKPLMKRANIYLLKIKDQSISESFSLKELRENPWIKNAQYDHYIKERQTFPDDTNF